MPSYSRELTVLGLLGATLWLPQCSQLTKVDWSLIQPGAGMTSSGGSSGTTGTTGGLAGENDEAGEGGTSAAGAAGAAGEAGASGEGDTGGASAGFGTGGGGASGSGGASGGSGGTLGGTGGVAGSAGAAGAHIVHPTCETAPPTPTTAPDLTGKIILFDGGPGTNGNRSGPCAAGGSTGRCGVDAACAAAKTKLQLPGSEVHAVISTSPDDEIFDMRIKWKVPFNSKPVVSPLGIVIAESWQAIWSSAVTPSLVCSGVMPVGVRTWLTGSTLDKQLDPDNVQAAYFGSYSGVVGGENNTCDGWTLGTLSNAVRAQVGSTIADRDTDAPPFFLNRFVTTCDAATSNILCATYDP